MFYRNSLEENKPVRLPVLLMMAGYMFVLAHTATFITYRVALALGG